ncbi:MAG: metal ABC transporter permease [Clostridiales bacterium]|nr:metal ABC transporter permease [Clostridiales bacterium]MDD7433272.1 metal ABC transporter permease [Clostridiales bacterium]MDY3062118.1 metal ABC transporter permease [Eubacteriales bacterium]
MLNLLTEMLSYPFMLRALVVGVLVSLCAALLGVPLVLKRYSMIGDGLSHVGFGALAIATALRAAPLAVTLPVVVLAAFFLLQLHDSSKIKGDAAIALISTGSLALGVMVLSLTPGMNTDINNFLFGSILGVGEDEMWLTAGLSLMVILLYGLSYNRIFALTFDESFAQATGLRTKVYNTLLALLTAVTIVLGMRTMGSLLISSLIVFPALSSMQLLRSFRSVLLLSVLVSLFCFISGLILSYLYSAPTGASVALLHVAVFILFAAIARIKPLRDS